MARVACFFQAVVREQPHSPHQLRNSTAMEPSANPHLRPPATPARKRLVEMRRHLMRLHKALIDAERTRFEEVHGRQTSGQLLQALIHDPFFAWLRPFSQLITRIDAAAADKQSPVTDDAARDFAREAGALLLRPVEDGEDAERYEELRRRDPAVRFTHTELARILTSDSGT